MNNPPTNSRARMRREARRRDLSSSLRFPAIDNIFELSDVPEEMDNDDVSRNPGASTGPPNVEQVLVHLDSIKTDIIQGMQQSIEALRQETEALRRDVVQKLASVSSEMEKAVLSTSRVMTRTQGSRSQGSGSRKRRLPAADEVKDIALVADRDAAFVALIRVTMLFTVFSFINAFPHAEPWVTEKLKENMVDVIPLLADVSGFSLLFFSVAADDPKTRFRSRMGELWSRLLRSAIVVMVLTARSTHYTGSVAQDGATSEEQRRLSGWLSSLGGMKKATGIVGEIVECLEHTNQVPMVRAAKKPRREEDSTEAVDDPHRGEREQAVRVMRSVILRALSTGRTDARVHIFKSFLFLVEKIRSFENVAVAKANGYDIMLHAGGTSDELMLPVNIAGTRWDIAKSQVQTEGDNNSEATNSALLQELTSRFPSLFVRLRYKRRVVCGKQVVPVDLCDEDGELYWDVEENLSLHRVAMGVMVEIFKAKNYLTILGTSGLSLCAVHVFALALRGFIKKSIDLPLSSVEKAALGDVTFRVLEKDEDLASVMLGVRSEKSKEGSENSTLDRERTQKLEMTWSAYEVAKTKRDEEMRGAGASTRSSAHQTSATAHVYADDDFDVGWLAGGGDNERELFGFVFGGAV